MATSRDTGNIFARFITAQKLEEWNKTERVNLDDFASVHNQGITETTINCLINQTSFLRRDFSFNLVVLCPLRLTGAGFTRR